MTKINPAFVEWDLAPEHDANLLGEAVVTKYLLQLRPASAAYPTLTIDCGKPSSALGTRQVSTVPTLVKKVSYKAQILVCGPGGQSASPDSASFAQVGKPSPVSSAPTLR